MKLIRLLFRSSLLFSFSLLNLWLLLQASCHALVCTELSIAKFPAGKYNSCSLTTIALLHTDIDGSLALKLSWRQQTVGLYSADGWSRWTSGISFLRTIVLHLGRNGYLIMGNGELIIWKSQSHGIRVTSVELLEPGERMVIYERGDHHCWGSQRRSKKGINRVAKRSSNGLRRTILQLNSEANSTETEANAMSDSSPSSNDPYDSTKKILAVEIVVPVLGFLLLLILFLGLAKVIRRRGLKVQRSMNFLWKTRPTDVEAQINSRIQEDEVMLEGLGPGLPPRFTYAEMEEATGGFRKKLGEGGYGAVYEGTIRCSGARVAVKVFLDTASATCRMGFCKEVMSIGEKKHHNLVQLKGFCVEDEHRMLVYELMENGSLNKALFGRKVSTEDRQSKDQERWEEPLQESQLTWKRRRSIILDTAKALAFLHKDDNEGGAVIHCDLKPENILLNESWVAKVSDFGLAKLHWAGCGGGSHHSPSDTHTGGGGGSSATWDATCLMTSKGVRGTLGYVAPELLRLEENESNPITAASDVYSFGVVLLEIVAGRRSMVRGLPFLPGLAFDMLEKEADLSALLDSGLLQDTSPNAAALQREDLEDIRNVVKIGLWCLQEDITLRPTMHKVVDMLTDRSSVSMPPFCSYFEGSSHFFDEVDSSVPNPMFSSCVVPSSDKEQGNSVLTSYEQTSWQTSILSGR
ncbi:hypothetical protein KP509_26G026700 [Ceratopteris richardii]|uniref:Protein kinase domain-containing protein n=1 Tax=Ceratopteris richardii TaxID=49495 RepID=A0A8T2RJF7_CERRI|nr:hypothetical protein KP509_26G026700 [Ceratopteris richardii]